MTTQPEALLADELESGAPVQQSAAAELRRLHEEVQEQCRLNGMGSEREARLMAINQELLKILKAFSDYVRDEQSSTDGAVTYSTTAINHWAFLARAAINKATGKQA